MTIIKPRTPFYTLSFFLESRLFKCYDFYKPCRRNRIIENDRSCSQHRLFKVFKPIKLISLTIGLSVCTTFNHAKLPDEIELALQQANIDSNSVSMIVKPVNHLTYNSASFSDNRHVNSRHSRSNSALYDVAHTYLDDVTLPSHSALNLNTNLTTLSANPTLGFRHNQTTARTPASVMKLVPTLVALDTLGSSFRWYTKVYHTGLVVDNTLYGDLIIQGSGDPKFTHHSLDTLLSQIKQKGIQNIEGDIIIDASIFRSVSKDPAIFDNQSSRPYNVSPDGMLINFSSLEVNAIVPTHSHLAYLDYFPKLADFSLPRSIAVENGACKSVVTKLKPVWQVNAVRFNNKLPAGCHANTFYIAYPDVKDFAKRAIVAHWQNLGNSLSGTVISTETPQADQFGNYLKFHKAGSALVQPKRLHSLYHLSQLIPSSPLPFVTYASSPLSSQIYDINHYSNNVMTEQLLLSIPAYQNRHQVSPNTTQLKRINTDSNSYFDTDNTHSMRYGYSNYTKALDLINRWWLSNLTTPVPNLTNASGLCRDCSITANNLAELLEHAYHHSEFDTYLNSLAVAGVNGTIRSHASRLPHSAAIGKAWIKTGTIDNASSMAGYVHGNSGQDYVVVGLINSSDINNKLDTRKARYVLDVMLDWTAKH